MFKKNACLFTFNLLIIFQSFGQQNKNGISNALITPNGKYSFTYNEAEQVITQWDNETLKPFNFFSDSAEGDVILSISGDGKFLLASDLKKTIIITPEDGLMKSFQLIHGIINNDATFMVSVDQFKNKILICSLDSCHEIKSINLPKNYNYPLIKPSLSTNGKIIAVCNGEFEGKISVLIYNLETGTLLSTIKTHAGLRCIALNPEGSNLACGFKANVITIYETATGNSIRTINNKGTNDCSDLGYFADGKYLYTALVDKGAIWDVTSNPKTTKLVYKMFEYNYPFTYMSLSEDGQYILVAAGPNIDFAILVNVNKPESVKKLSK